MPGDEFEQMSHHIFNKMEEQVGPEMYETTVEHNRAVIKYIKEDTLRKNTVTTCIQMMMFLSVVTAVPLYFLLWKAVLRW